MAWTITTYSGQKANGPSGNWRVGMHELCRALNEREGALALTKTQFYKGDGTQGSDLAFDDFLGLVTSGDSKVKTNLERIRSRLAALVAAECFTETSGKSDLWTWAALETDIGLGSIAVSPTSATDALFWQQMKELLDRLIYGHDNILIAYSTHDYRQSNLAFFYSTWQASWDAAVGYSPDSRTSAHRLRWSIAWAGPPVVNDRRSFIEDNLSGSFVVPDFGGSLSEYWFNYTVTESPSGALAGAMNINIGATYLSSPSASGSVLGDGGDVTFGTTNSINVDTDGTPTSFPMTVPSVSGRHYFNVTVDSVDLYLDLASELTDQA